MAGLYDLKCNTMQWWAFPGIRFKEPCSDRDFSPLAARNDRQTAPLTPQKSNHRENDVMTVAAELRETGRLIGSDKVEGTAVYDPDGKKIGSIERVMIEKISGRVSYAVLSFGGFLGIGDDHYPLPWPSLKYSVELGGYQIMIPREQIENAPKYAREGEWDWSDRSRTRAVDDYYGVPIT